MGSWVPAPILKSPKTQEGLLRATGKCRRELAPAWAQRERERERESPQGFCVLIYFPSANTNTRVWPVPSSLSFSQQPSHTPPPSPPRPGPPAAQARKLHVARVLRNFRRGFLGTLTRKCRGVPAGDTSPPCPPQPQAPQLGPDHEPAGRPGFRAAHPAVQQGQDEKAPEEEPEREVPVEVPAAAQSSQGYGVCESGFSRSLPGTVLPTCSSPRETVSGQR